MRLFEKKEKPKHVSLLLRWRGERRGGKKKYNIKMSNVRLKVAGLQIMVISLKLKPAFQVPQTWTGRGLQQQGGIIQYGKEG